MTEFLATRPIYTKCHKVKHNLMATLIIPACHIKMICYSTIQNSAILNSSNPDPRMYNSTRLPPYNQKGDFLHITEKRLKGLDNDN